MIKIAILGLGTVGTGVVKVVEANTAPIQHKLGQPLSVKTALVRKLRADPYQHLMTENFREIEHDGEIRVVVETIGGVEAAYEYPRRCLNRVDEIYGILNGTTNFILTKMVKEGASFAEALKLAQEKGYAEADPTADVEGIDAGRKICILADLAFGHQVDPAQVPMEGITGIDLKDVEIAGRHGYRIKLLGRCLRLEGGRRTAYVAPHLISEENPMSDVNDVFNAVVVRGNATGEVMFYGKGAGELPTASACVADVIECLQEERHRPEIGWSADTGGFASPLTLKNRWYFRVGTDTLPEALHSAKVLEQDTETAFITPPITGTDAERLAAYLPTLAKMRVLD